MSRIAWRTRTSLKGGWLTRMVKGIHWPPAEMTDLRPGMFFTCRAVLWSASA